LASRAAPPSGTSPTLELPGEPPTAELRPVSVLFVDLVGFTALSEVREADDVRELLGRYFEIARTIIERHGGVVEKFIGDAVMAVWGARVAREDDAERAVRAALSVVEAVAVSAEELGAPRLQARAGVVTGQAAAMGTRGEGLVVGDRVNTASRVQSLAQPGTVLVDEVTRQVAAAAIAFQDTGEHAAKGKAQPLRLWRAMRVIAGLGGLDREQAWEPPLVGRDGDLWLVKELFHGALERRSARLVAVSGEAGVGKSRVRREFFNYVDGLSTQVMWHLAACSSFAEGMAYTAPAEVVRQRLGITADASPQDAAVKLAEGLDRWVGDAADREFLRPRLGALLALEEPGLARDELFAGWRLFFERLAEHLPVVLVFEDAQWADKGLLDLIEQLLDWSVSSPIFILTLARTDTAPGDEEWPGGRPGGMALRLEPLDQRAMRSLLAGVVDGLPADATARIMERAQGVPLYAIEIIRTLADQGVLDQREGRLVLRDKLGDLNVPATLSSLLAARLDALEPAERGFVKAMSVLAGSFSRSTAAALGGIDEAQLDAVLASLVRKQVLAIRSDRLSPDQGQYVFAQGLLRMVAYEMLSHRERVPRHIAAAEHLRRTVPNDGEDVAEQIASHYLDAYRAASQHPRAVELCESAIAALRRAARRAATVGAPEAAERFYRTAAELADGDDDQNALTEAAGEMAFRSGRYEAAVELLEVASNAHVSSGRERDAARIAADIGYALGRMGHLREAVERYRAALHVLGGDRLDADVAQLNARLALALITLGDYEQAEPPLEAALATAEALDLPAVLCDALGYKAMVHNWTGRVQQARYLWIAAIEIAERHELDRQLTTTRTNLGNLAVLSDLPDAEVHISAALALARRRGDRTVESLNASNLMMVWVLSGQWPQAEQLANQLLEDNKNRPAGEALHYVLAILNLQRGDHVAARAAFERMAAWEHIEDEERRAGHAAIAVSILLAEGHPDRALEHGEPLLARAIDGLGANHESVRQAWPETVRAALQIGRSDAARRVFDLVARRPPGNVPPYLTAQLVRGRALINMAKRDDDTVAADLTAAIGAFRKLAYPYWTAVAQADLAAWMASRERGQQAAELLTEANGTFVSLGAPLVPARADGLQRVERDRRLRSA
jgi:class 3 adenylate cyclase/tetratricopeptide (TPR) repeat protein